MKTFETIKICSWYEGIYTINLFTKEEIVYDDIPNVDIIIDKLNKEGFFVSACHNPNQQEGIIYMTREIEN